MRPVKHAPHYHCHMDYRLDVAMVQWQPQENPADNTARVYDLARTASDADLIVFPEYSQHLSERLDVTAADAAEALDGQFVTALREMSAETEATVIAGMLERDGDRVFNTLVACTAGAVAATYRKVHLYDSFGGGESDWASAGSAEQAAVIDVAGAPIGLQTCYDLRFPETTRRLVDRGAETIVIPADWVPGSLKEQQWLTLASARAIENTSYVLAVDVAPPLGVGHTTAFDPRGVAIAAAGDAPEAIVRTQLSSGEVARVRSANPSVSLRRYEVSPKALA